MGLDSFGSGLTAVVFGASGGIGAAFVAALMADPAFAQVHAVSRGGDAGGTTAHRCDYDREADIASVARTIGADGPVHLVIVAIGMLHGKGVSPEKTWKHIDGDAMARVIAANTIAPTLIAKHMLPLLAKDRKAVFAALSARVGSISDNRLGGWISYRASKAALNMVLRTLSIELARVNTSALILGLHPGTVDTTLSEPFQGNVPDGALFSPEDSVAKMLTTIDRATTDDTGNVLAYDGSPICA